MAPETRRVSVRIDPVLHQRAKLLSVREGVSLQAVLEDLLRKWVNHMEGAR
jgi:predicted HicB family RNase H-like nuclease